MDTKNETSISTSTLDQLRAIRDGLNLQNPAVKVCRWRDTEHIRAYHMEYPYVPADAPVVTMNDTNEILEALAEVL
jgi:hypothetical protein